MKLTKLFSLVGILLITVAFASVANASEHHQRFNHLSDAIEACGGYHNARVYACKTGDMSEACISGPGMSFSEAREFFRNLSTRSPYCGGVWVVYDEGVQEDVVQGQPVQQEVQQQSCGFDASGIFSAALEALPSLFQQGGGGSCGGGGYRDHGSRQPNVNVSVNVNNNATGGSVTVNQPRPTQPRPQPTPICRPTPIVCHTPPPSSTPCPPGYSPASQQPWQVTSYPQGTPGTLPYPTPRPPATGDPVYGPDGQQIGTVSNKGTTTGTSAAMKSSTIAALKGKAGVQSTAATAKPTTTLANFGKTGTLNGGASASSKVGASNSTGFASKGTTSTSRGLSLGTNSKSTVGSNSFASRNNARTNFGGMSTRSTFGQVNRVRTNSFRTPHFSAPHVSFRSSGGGGHGRRK